jgi:hypothetical protein
MVEVSSKNVTMNPLSGWSYGFRYLTLINSGEVLNGRFESGMGSAIPPDLQKELDNLSYRTDGPWTLAQTANGTEVFNATMCFISQNLPHKFNVTMTGKAVASEHTFSTELSSLTVLRNDTGVLRQLGVAISPDNTTGRGTLDLEVRSGPDLWMELDGEVSIQSAYLELWVTLVEFPLSVAGASQATLCSMTSPLRSFGRRIQSMQLCSRKSSMRPATQH